ncbi:MAG: DUF1552 domain-containing protein [Planctomycetota bacterium]
MFDRRDFFYRLGVSSAAAQFAWALPSFGGTSDSAKQRLIFVFTPNGVIPKHFWPELEGKTGEAPLGELKRILKPLEPFKDQVVTLQGINNRIKGDGDGHMRGIGCLLTGIELFPGDIQGGSDTPAGWSMGISLDQYLRNEFQKQAETQTRFGSLEFGVLVPDRADTWTRWSYRGANQPVAPISNPYQMFDKLYGQTQNRAMLASVLDDLGDDFKKLSSMASADDRRLLERHLEMVRNIEKELQQELTLSARGDDAIEESSHAVPELPPNVKHANDNMPQISRMQNELLASAMAADFARVATYQVTNSVGNAKMTWLDINEGHHAISHEPDKNEAAYEKLIRINTWYCEQIAHLAKRLRDTPEPGGDGNLLDNTTIVWTNELGKGNSHTRDNIPFVMIGGGLRRETGRAIRYDGVNHNRLLMSIAEAMGKPVESFGNKDFCEGGSLVI